MESWLKVPVVIQIVSTKINPYSGGTPPVFGMFSALEVGDATAAVMLMFIRLILLGLDRLLC